MVEFALPSIKCSVVRVQPTSVPRHPTAVPIRFFFRLSRGKLPRAPRSSGGPVFGVRPRCASGFCPGWSSCWTPLRATLRQTLQISRSRWYAGFAAVMLDQAGRPLSANSIVSLVSTVAHLLTAPERWRFRFSSSVYAEQPDHFHTGLAEAGGPRVQHVGRGGDEKTWRRCIHIKVVSTNMNLLGVRSTRAARPRDRRENGTLST